MQPRKHEDPEKNDTKKNNDDLFRIFVSSWLHLRTVK